MTAGRRVPLRWVLLAVFVPVVAGTGLAISSLMAQRMRAFALDSTQAELKTEVAVIRKRWERIVDPERTLTHLEVIDGLVAAIPNPGVDVHRKVLIESAQLFDEASHLASVNVLKTDGQFIRFHNARLLNALALPDGTRLMVERYAPDQRKPGFVLLMTSSNGWRPGHRCRAVGATAILGSGRRSPRPWLATRNRCCRKPISTRCWVHC